MEDLNIINKEDKAYYDEFFKFSVYSGASIGSVTYGVYASCIEQALELAVAFAELHDSHILFDFDSIRDYVYTTFEDEYREWLSDKSGEEYSYDESWFEFAQEYLNYIYVDATEYGASQPYFIDGTQMSIEEANDEPIVFEDKEPKKEFLDADVNISTGDISSNLDLGGLGALAGLMASEEPKESEEKLEETRIPAQKLIDKYKDTDKVTFKDIKADLDSYSPEASDETIEGLMAQVKAGLEALGFKANETELVKENLSESKEDQPVEKVIADFKFGSNWRAVIIKGEDEDEVKFYDLSASKNKFPQGEDMDNTYSITTLLLHKSDYIDNGATMYKDYTSRKFILSGEDMKDFFNKLDKIEGINYGKDFNTDDVDKYSAFDKKIRDLSKVKSNDKKYKQVVVTFGCDDCGHKEDRTFDDMFEWQLADLEASDSNNEVGDCPECGSIYYNMKDYKIIEESKSKKEETEDEVDDYGPYYVKEFNEDGTDIDTVGFDSEQEATDYAEENIKKHPDHEYAVYETASDECLYLYDKTYFEESKSKKEEYYQMPEDEHIIWDSEIDYYDKDYMDSVKKGQYQDYLDDLGEEEPEDFESWYEGYIDDMSYEDARWLEEDLDDNILPNIDKQLNDNVLLLSGSYGSNYADFRPSGEGGVFWENGTDDFKSYISGFDRVCITTHNGILGAICNDHDGTVSGQFYTLPDDKTELIKALGYEEEGRKIFDEYDEYGGLRIADYDNVEEFLQDYMPQQFDEDLYYGGIDASDLNKHIDLLKPIKDTISGYAPQDPNGTKTESKEIKTELKKGQTISVVYTDADGNEKTTHFKCDKNYDIDGEQIRVAIKSEDKDIVEIIKLEESKKTESKKVECKELKTESVSYQDLVIAGESLWRDDARIYETRVEGIYDCQTAGHGGYLVDTDVFPELAKYGDKTPIDNIVGFEEDYEALKVIWAVPEVLEKIQLDKDWYKNLTLDDVLRYEDKLNDDFRKEFPNKKEIAEVPEMKTENVNEDAKIEKAIKEYIDKNNGIFTDDSAYDIAETITGIKDIDKLPDGLVDNIRNILHTKFKKEENVDQTNKVESKQPSLTGDETYVARNSSGYKSIGLIVNNETKQFQIINGQVMTTDSRTKKMSKKQIRDKAQQLYDKGYAEYDGYGSVAQGVNKNEDKEVKTEGTTLEQEITKYKKYIDDNTRQHLEKLEKDLLAIDGVTGVEYDLAPYANDTESPIILVKYDQENTSFKLLKSVVETIQANGVKVEIDELEDNDTYFYIVTYTNNWSKVTESKKLKKENPQQDEAVNSFFNQMDKYMDSKGTDMEALKGIENTANDVYKFRPEFTDMRYGDMYRALSKEYVRENKLTEALVRKLNKITETLKKESSINGEWLDKDNVDNYREGTVWVEVDIDPDYIEIDYENEDTDEEWLDKVFKVVQTKATEYDVKVMDLIQAPNGYSVVLKGTLQDIVDFMYDQKNYSIDKCIDDMDIEISRAPLQERLLGPSDEVVADSKAKGLYTEDDNEGAKDEIKKDLGIEPGSDEEAQLNDIFDTDYDLVWDGLDDEEQNKYLEIAKSVRRLKPDEAFIDVKQEIDDKAKKNHLETDILTFVYLDKINEKTESKTDKPVKILRNPDDKNERVEIYKLPSGKYQTLYYTDEKSYAGSFSKFDDLDSAVKQAQKLRPNYILDESEQQSIPNIKLENKTFKR